MKTRSQRKNRHRTETEPPALSELLVFSERPLSQQHVVTRQLIRKQKMPKKDFVIKKPTIFMKIQKQSRNTTTSFEQAFSNFRASIKATTRG